MVDSLLPYSSIIIGPIRELHVSAVLPITSMDPIGTLVNTVSLSISQLII